MAKRLPLMWKCQGVGEASGDSVPRLLCSSPGPFAFEKAGFRIARQGKHIVMTDGTNVLRKLTVDVLSPKEVDDEVIARAIALTRSCEGVPTMRGRSRISVSLMTRSAEGAWIW